ncbi:PhoD-like phosphatase [Xylariales sp. PMI_506]|nr:PhoD-like phosphatase [Xylariales sp. PMI_506]
MDYQRRAAAFASAGIKVATYFFLRWAAVPHLIYVVSTLFAIYAPTFVSLYLREPRFALVDEVVLAVQDKLVNEDDVVNGTTDTAVIDPEVVVVEEIAAIKRPIAPLKTILSGLPSPNSMLFTVLGFAANVACLAMIFDVVYRPRLQYPSHDLSFARIGYVSNTEAKLLIREPDQSKMPITVEIHVKDAQAASGNQLWQTAGGVRWTTDETDFTAVVAIPLRHSKQRVYEWRTSNNHSGEFVSAPKPGAVPDYNDGKFTFLATSCILPRLPYNPLDHALTIPGMRHLAKVLPSLGAQFMLFMGDFIYVDVPNRFGKSVEDYRQKYRQVYASPDWPSVGQNLSWIHVLDDHEILNDWDAKSSGVYEAAVDPWHHYQTAVNPPRAKRAGSSGAITRVGTTYFSFTQGPASFFMLDTRSYRSKNSEPFESANKTMLGTEQLEDLLYWLHQPEPKGVKWKIIASSVPLTKNWRVNTRDTWGGFLYERQRVLEGMWDAGVAGYGVVVLSGDRHEFGATAFPPPKDGKWPQSVTVHEFSASPLNQFYSPIPTYRQTDDEDVELKYINTGNSKFGALTIENVAGGEQSSLHYSLYVDGLEKWNTIIVTPEVVGNTKPSHSLWDRIIGVI